jgi:CHAT domain-containing protein
MSNPSLDPKQSQAAQQLYDWIIAPFEAEHLDPAQLDSLLFCLGNGLRGLPIAALQNEKNQYLIEKYSVASIPAFNLINTRYRPVKSGQILAAGASKFKELSPLPAVPFELEMIQSELRNTPVSSHQWKGRSLLNQTFTLDQWQSELSSPFNIIHLATHAEFRPGQPKKSFIQFQDQRLKLAEMDQIQWPKDLDLLVLSACQTAVGDPQAELGFAGIALKANIKSVVGSLWHVSDLGTLALMNEFYHHLPQSPTKAIALQQAQLSLLNGKTHVQQDLLHSQRGQTPLPIEIALGQVSNFSHPYYWAGFTLLSSPW